MPPRNLQPTRHWTYAAVEEDHDARSPPSHPLTSRAQRAARRNQTRDPVGRQEPEDNTSPVAPQTPDYHQTQDNTGTYIVPLMCSP